jgi:hypothetical protein
LILVLLDREVEPATQVQDDFEKRRCRYSASVVTATEPTGANARRTSDRDAMTLRRTADDSKPTDSHKDNDAPSIFYDALTEISCPPWLVASRFSLKLIAYRPSST